MSPQSRKHRLLLVDDHFVARFGARKLLSACDDLQVIGEARDGSEAVALSRTHEPDAILMDLRMDRFDGLSATRAIVDIQPDARVLIVSSYDTDIDVQRARKAGARGFVAKEAGPTTLLEAVRTVLSGQEYLPAHLAARLHDLEERPGLSAREMQLLRLLAGGMTNRQIASHTALTLGTVKVYVCHLLAKLGVNNRSEAVYQARRSGLVTGVSVNPGREAARAPLRASQG